MTTLQKTLIAVTIAAAFGTGIYIARRATILSIENQAHLQQQSPTKLSEETRLYRLRGGLIQPAERDSGQAVRTNSMANNPVTLQDTQKIVRTVHGIVPQLVALERAITNLFTGSKWFIDYEQNVVIARGTPKQLQVMDKIVEEFNVR